MHRKIASKTVSSCIKLKIQNVALVVVLLFPAAFSAGAVPSKSKRTELEKCLRDQKQVQECVVSEIKPLTIEKCYAESAKLISNYLKEETLDFCFYRISEFPSLNTCLKKAELFQQADWHDNALFECVRQHQLNLSKESCNAVARQMRYPEKSKYLMRYCDSL